jgi:hypothetical protein
VTRAEGTITGTAANCSTRHASTVTVVVLEDAALRTSATIRSGSRFEFHLSPGHYVLSTGHLYSHVTLGAGAHVTVDLVTNCPRRGL